MPDDRDVEEALEDVLRWEAISRSPQLAKFLRYIVKATLAGDEQSIKAYAIAVDVFGRPPSFDPQTDPIVRVQARRLRLLLDRFYASGLAKGSVRIRLPVGRYVPQFEDFSAPALLSPTDGEAGAHRELPASVDDSPSVPEDASVADAAVSSAWPPGVLLASRTLLILAAGGLVLVAVAFQFGWFGLSTSRAGAPAPIVYVGNFSNLTGLPQIDVISGDLKQAVVNDLSGFGDIIVSTSDTARSPPPSAQLLTGLIRRSVDGIDISALLVRRVDGSATWNTVVSAPVPDSGQSPLAVDVARKIVSRLAAFHGPLYRAGLDWLAQQNGLEDSPTLYSCMLRFRLSAESERRGDRAVATACFKRLLEATPRDAIALAGAAWLTADAALDNANVNDNVTQILQPGLTTAQQAVALGPQNSFAHGQLARILDLAGRRTEAAIHFNTALTLNPADTDIRAAYAQTLALAGNWQQGMTEAEEAITAAPSPPPWYQAVPMLDAYRRHDYEKSLRLALSYASANVGIAPVIALASGAWQKRADIVGKFLTVVMAEERLRRGGILTRLELRLHDPSLLSAIADGLALAGVPQAAMRKAF